MPISKENKYSICKSCYEKLYFIKNACDKCGKPIINRNLDKNVDICKCSYCKNKRFLFDRNISVIEYDETSSKLVFKLKYSSNTHLAKIIAEIIFEKLFINGNEFVEQPYILTYVPLSEKRKKERGFNQSEKICHYLAKKLEIKESDIIQRKKDTRKLFGLDLIQRKKELKNSFEIKNEFVEVLSGKNIVIVDDIFTTGSTIDEISKELRKYDVGKIISITLLTGKYVNNEVCIDR